ncbi:MAG TPA: TIGR04086 family membrane protein [Tissierellaceae bacterium]|nr:TIGR04086 family membrane protein [Tissierellaceae bacterium]
MENKVKFTYWLKGLILSYAISFTLIIIVSLLLHFTSLRENKLSMLNNIIMIISISIASIYLSIKIKERGWLNGFLLGFSYYFVIILINFIADRSISINLILGTKLISASLMGTIGGMIGVNLN